MTFHWYKIAILLTAFLIIIQISLAMDKSKEDSDDSSSSEETEENSSETGHRRRRFIENHDTSKLPENVLKNTRLGLPSISDVETLLKIAEILTTLGQQIIPNIISGNRTTSKFIKQRIAHDRLMLQNIKNEVAALTKHVNGKMTWL